jgi:hypothetical protein
LKKMDAKLKKTLLTIAQTVAGGIAGVIACLLSLTLINLIWQNAYPSSMMGFIRGILLLISFLVVLGASLVAVSETVRQFKRFIPREAIYRKSIYEGCFLGICAAVSLLSVTRGDWINSLEEWGGGIKLIATLFYLVVSLPLKLVTFWIPALIVLAISAPIGATIGFYLIPHIKGKKEAEGLAEGTQN